MRVTLPPADLGLTTADACTSEPRRGSGPGATGATGPTDLWGLPAAVGVEEPLTSRPDYLGQPRDERDPLDKTLWMPPVPTFTYLAGAAGCGKTWAVRDWASRERGLLLCATTGIAAINGGGTTINSLLGYFDTQSLMESYTNGFLAARLGKLWRAGCRRIVLDEVSMLDGDQLTYLVKGVEEVNGRGYVITDPDDVDTSTDGTGGLGLTVVGDFCQLPPVNAPFAFESTEWDRFPPATITLTEIRRQADPAFIEALRQCRRGEGHRALDVFGPGMARTTDDQFDGPTLFAKNAQVDRYNWIRMNQLQGEAHAEILYTNDRWGKQRQEWGNPQRPPNTWGIPPRLPLKIGCLVMILANRKVDGLGGQSSFLYVNGDLGTVVDGDPARHTCGVRLHRTGQVVEVIYVRREVLTPLDSARRKELKATGKADLISENGRYEIEGWVDYLPLRVAYASTVHKCVAGGTRILVHKRGAITIDQARVGDYIDTGFGPARLIAAKQTWQRAYRLTTERGYTILCSGDHRWMAENDLIETQRLRKGMSLLLTPETTVEGTHVVEADTAWWIGASLGDANWTDRREGQIHFANIDEGLRRRWIQVAQRLGGRPNTRRDRRGCHLTSLPVRLRLAAWGCDYVTAINKRIPAVIWESGQSAWAACLRGLFDTDGAMKDGRLLLATRSVGLAADSQQLLLYLGIPSTLGVYTGRTGPYYHIRISAEGRDRFAARIGFTHAKKQRALEAWTPNRQLKPYDGTDRVRKVEKLGIEIPMFDVELNAIHRLGFGPFCGSNSQGLSLDKVQVNIADGFFKTPGMLYVALSRARSLAGLRLVGSSAAFIERCVTDPRLKGWL